MTNKRCEIKTGKSDCVFYFTMHLFGGLYRGSCCDWRCEKIVLRHTLQYTRVCFLFVHGFCFVLFHLVPFPTLRRETIRPRFSKPDKSHTEGEFFRGKKPKSRVVLHKTQVASGIIMYVYKFETRLVAIPTIITYHSYRYYHYYNYYYYTYTYTYIFVAKTQQYILFWEW